ncbi:MAG: hypothetical protein AABY54_01180 [Deltaproteobacteria bacterium]
MKRSDSILIDINNPVFQEDLFSLEKEEAINILGTLRKIKKLSWIEVYKDKGLKWELVQSKTGLGKQRLYTVRVSKKFRAVVYREAQFIRFLSLHPDHDSAYR